MTLPASSEERGVIVGGSQDLSRSTCVILTTALAKFSWSIPDLSVFQKATVLASDSGTMDCGYDGVK